MPRIAITSKIFLTLLGSWLLTSCDTQTKPNAQTPTFENTLAVHLNAIKTANLTELEPTVGERVAMISPTGNKMDSKEVFMKFHKSWFSKKDWEWEGDIVRTEKSDSLGYALIKYKFSKKDSVGNTLFQDNEYLVLIFKNSAQGWQLVHDQNTQIKQ
jgi:hypothetical protein